MPKILHARPAMDTAEEKRFRKAGRGSACPVDWFHRTRMVSLSWSGSRVSAGRPVRGQDGERDAVDESGPPEGLWTLSPRRPGGHRGAPHPVLDA